MASSDRRKRCIRIRRGTSCKFCTERKLQCSIIPELSRSPEKVYGPADDRRLSSTRCSSTALLDQDLSVELAELYFRHVQNAFPHVFHRPSFMVAVRKKTVPRLLFFAAISLSARFSSNPCFDGVNPRDRGRPYAKEAEKLLDLHETSLATIQACILLAIHSMAECEANTESVYFVVACRMAMLLDLPNAPTKTSIEKEVNCRVWWSLVTMDTWSSAALHLPRSIIPGKDVPLPMDEWTFAHLSGDERSLTESPGGIQPLQPGQPSLSFLAHLVRLNRLLNEVYKLSVAIVAEDVQGEALGRSIRDLSRSLDSWASGLPAEIRYTEANVSFWAEQGFGRPFIVLHINYNHAGQLLYYQFLSFDTESNRAISTDSALAYANSCKAHAANICDITYQAKQSPETDGLGTLSGHVLVIASTVQLHGLLFNVHDEEIALAKIRLERNFELLTHLHTYWSNVGISFSRLRAFHDACLKNEDTLFRLDRWMLQFMLEFSRPIDNKDKSVCTSRELLRPLDQLIDGP
ncbi:hypothetical protein AK830_g3416 [Neonectria ditissima]|uniref:Xylanolytic transcriptional activator regulatory domain-containing protein n=1 Tax=Neonectria ditissima TaxID=78410 RepID=A0A0P7BC22_9HYPO|nr:hypothetical protein AK830_g3416 [Neonectria ditissima]